MWDRSSNTLKTQNLKQINMYYVNVTLENQTRTQDKTETKTKKNEIIIKENNIDARVL